MQSLYFNFYGIVTCLEFGDNTPYVFFFEQLSADFSFFSSPTGEAALRIRISEDKEKLKAYKDSLKELRPWFRTKLCTAYQKKNRICEFYEGSLLVDRDAGKMRDAELFLSSMPAYDILYYYILSAVGELLEERGLYRIHAVAYTEREKSKCLPLDSGRGKTTIALQQLLETKNKILGDEVILTDGKILYPFPVRLALRPKVYEEFRTSVHSFTPVKRALGGEKFLVSIPADRVAAETREFTLVLSEAKIFFIIKFLLGLGLPQMREFMVRPKTLFWFPVLALGRLRCAFRLLRKKFDE